MRKKNVAASALVAIALIAAFAIGNSFGQKSMLSTASVQLNDVQAMLTFNRLSDERELQSLLVKGCVSQAGALLDFYKDKDMGLLADFLRGRLNNSTKQYLFSRDPNLATELPKFHSKFGGVWAVPDCKP
jgi:hypothetical protein